MGWRSSLDEAQASAVELHFDREYYLKKYADVQQAGAEPLDHFMEFGWKEMRDPSPRFPIASYVRAYLPQAVATDCNPLIHWIDAGGDFAVFDPVRMNAAANSQAVSSRFPMLTAKECHNVVQAFDADFYFSKHADVAISGQIALEHFLDYGWKECRDPCQSFSLVTFNIVNDLWYHVGNPFVHWVIERLDCLEAENIRRLAQVERPAQGDLHDDVKKYFDAKYYTDQYEWTFVDNDHAFEHFMTVGWRHFRDPSPEFSTFYYLQTHEDVRNACVNPLEHWVRYGKAEGRRRLPFRASIARRRIYEHLSVLVVLPNDQDIETLFAAVQPLAPLVNEVVVLANGPSTLSYAEYIFDVIWLDSTAEMAAGRDEFEVLSDSASGELVWFLGRDWSVDRCFPKSAIDVFNDISITMAVPSVERATVRPESNREDELPRQPDLLSLSASSWFSQSIVSGRILRPLTGFVCRKPALGANVRKAAARFPYLSGWFYALHLISGGHVAILPGSIRPSAAVGSTSSARRLPFREAEDLLVEIRSRWSVSEGVLSRFREILKQEGGIVREGPDAQGLGSFFDWRRVRAQGRSWPHIVVSFWAFWAGGGEFFPIMLANELCNRGLVVSMLGFDLDEINEDMRRRLHPSIAVFDAIWIDEEGGDSFLNSSQVSLVHSHTVGSEIRFFDIWRIKASLPYLATLHGSYESSDVSDKVLNRIAEQVSHFVYTADKNLLPLTSLDLPARRFTKLPNAMPVDRRAFPTSRQEMGIGASAIVFTLVARGVPEKGWHPTIKAFLRLRKKYPNKEMFLLLCGAGVEPDRLQPRYAKNTSIIFLGYQSCIHGLYRLSDVCLVASRFVGESYPLCIIQALQAETPVVTTRIGETAMMIGGDAPAGAGLLVEVRRKNVAFVAGLQAAMEAMLDDERRAAFKVAAIRFGLTYDMTRLCDIYDDLYDELIDEGQLHPAAPSVSGPRELGLRTEIETTAGPARDGRPGAVPDIEVGLGAVGSSGVMPQASSC